MIRATLLTDGSSGRVLVPVLEWVLGEATTDPSRIDWADLRGLRRPPQGLREKVVRALELYPCDLLFVHRDSEGQQSEQRHCEVADAVRSLRPFVSVVPVRMQEAWMLHDEDAIRRAAGQPSGRQQLGLPPATRLEAIADPKTVLHNALASACGLSGRRLRRFEPAKAAHRVAMLVRRDWSVLRALPAFVRLERDTRRALIGPRGSR